MHNVAPLGISRCRVSIYFKTISVELLKEIYCLSGWFQQLEVEFIFKRKNQGIS